MLPDEIKISMYEAWTEEMEAQQRRVLLARAYHDGNQPVALTDRQKKFLALNGDDKYCLNVCRLVVTTLCDELSVIGFDTNEQPNAEGKKPLAEWLSSVWKANKMDALQSEAHEWTVRDGQGFIILGWNKEKKIPTIALHEAWTSEDVSAWESSDSGVTADMVTEASGTGTGVYVKYKNNDPMQSVEFAVQYFYSEEIDDKGDIVQIHRRTIYYPDRIEREYVGDAGKWTEYEPVEMWRSNDDSPIGVPVIPFNNKDMRPEAWDAFPQQDAINKTDSDIQAAMDFYGFPTMWLFGMYPTTDGKPVAADNSNVLYMQPGQINGNSQLDPSKVSVTKMEASDPTALMNALKDRMMFVAQITGTPVTKFTSTAQVASAETLKEQKDTLKQRAKNRQVAFGDAWEQVMSMARRLNNVFGTGDEFDEALSISTIWRNVESIEDLQQEMMLGVPTETLWGRLGYSAEQVSVMKETPAYKLQFMKAFWEAYNVASASGVSVENFAIAVGLSEKEIKLLTATEIIPPTL